MDFEGMMAVEGYTKLYVDLKDFSFYYVRHKKMVKCPIEYHKEIGETIKVYRKKRTVRINVQLSYLKRHCHSLIHEKIEKKASELPIKPVIKLTQVTNMGHFGFTCCHDCGYLQPNEHTTCARCDQSLTPL